ncbi:RtcB family protein [Desulfobacterales bacterium HSG17]|nr:RtcB family protein [Desulfobacterales bacterium HSG17]
MKKVISSEKIPIKMWLDDIEDGALDQAKNLANLPFAFKNIAIMPDSHQGYGMPIGGVLAAKGVIIPNAVGVDIGCGMCALKTDLQNIDIEQLKKIFSIIRKSVPVGFEWHKKKQDEILMPTFKPELETEICLPVVHKQYKRALSQIGTLGGGNHFIEIQKGSDNHIWIMVHSGSRNLGKQIADHYNRLAIKLNKRWHSKIPEKWQLAFLPLDTEQGQLYKNEMEYCVEFALANRKLMMDRIKLAFQAVIPEVNFEDFINIAHNYAALENHFSKNVMVHRKGATQAFEGQIGIIPGSQGTNSYIVKGKGNPDSFKSCSHGAGRKMGRKQAVRELDFEREKALMDAKGILHAMRYENDLDEAPGAYKDINKVMENQDDLVDIIVELSPLAVIKG